MGIASQRAKNDTIRFALSMAKRPKFADGGGVMEPVLSGPILAKDGGRNDTVAGQVQPGSYILPADVVSGLPGAQGSSLAGHNALTKLFASLPLTPDEAPYGAPNPNLSRGRTIPGLMSVRHATANAFDQTGHPTLARGGKTHSGAGHPLIPIMAAGDEFSVDPKYVRRLGYWANDKETDHHKREENHMRRGHEVLDGFVKDVRARNIKELKKLPGPVKS